MYNILIAEDEKIEREGIKYLIEQFSYPFNVIEAKNGRIALEYLKSNPVHILLTDIQMPFVNGLELAQHARNLNPELKIIIFSAYGEFEYAKKAINLNVIHYILKPVRVNEFQCVMDKIILMFDEELKKDLEQKRLMEGYHKGMAYETEKLLLGLISGIDVNKEFYKRAEFSGLDFNNKTIQMILFDFNKKFFDTEQEKFEELLKSALDINYYYLNINEQQSMVFIKRNGENSFKRQEVLDIAGKLSDLIKEAFKVECFMVFGKEVSKLEDIYPDYLSIEQVLENKFFLENTTILFTDECSQTKVLKNDSIDKTIHLIHHFIECREHRNIQQGIDLLFEQLKKSNSFSTLYIRHIFTDIVKRLYEKSNFNDLVKLEDSMRKIIHCNNILEVEEFITSVINKIYFDYVLNDEVNKKSVDQVLSIIRNEYANDLSVEYLAKKVYISPNYLSFLFKKHTGKNLVKYITEYRMERARELLDTTNIKVTDVGKMVSYSNQSYFGSLFKNYTGLSPAQYKERSK